MENIVSLSTTIYSAIFTPWGMAASLSKFLIYVFSLGAIGLMLVQLFLLRLPQKNIIVLRSSVIIMLILAALATISRVFVQAGQLMDDGFFGMFDPEIIAISLEGPMGKSTYIRLTGLLLILIAVLIRPVRAAATLSGAFLVAFSFALIGHATREPQWLLGGLITVHLLAISYWFGALPPLYKLANPKKDLGLAASIADKFGKQAMVLVPVLIVAGIVFSWQTLGSLEALFATNYGRILLIKTGIVSIILLFAALNKFKFVPDLEKSKPNAAVVFRFSLVFESCIFFFVFAITAVLTTSFSVPA